MAPRGRRGEASEPQAFHELGVRGRKTGVALPNRGEVDEQGFQPLDSIFSSPQKGSASANGDDGSDDDDDAGSEDMDIASSAGPGPRTLLKGQRNVQYPIPRSRSPMKTTLLSPARKNPHLERLSSPIHEDRDATVTRKLDFSRTGPSRPAKTNGLNGTVPEEESEEEEDDAVVDADDGLDMVDDEAPSMAGALADDDQLPALLEADSDVEDEDEEPIVQQVSNKGRGRAKAAPAEVEAPPSSQKKRGRPAKNSKPATAPSPAPARGSKKRRSLRSSEGGEEEDEQPQESEDEQPAKRQRNTKGPAKAAPAKVKQSQAAAAAKAKEPQKPRGKPGRKPKQVDDGGDDAGETSFMALQKGPPMPKRRGLVSVKRDADVVVQTRSGRHSFRPLNWWAGDQVITEEEERDDMFTNDRGFVLKSVKEIVRVPDELPPSKRAPRSKARSKTKAKPQPLIEDEELEEWEKDPGTVVSEVVAWEPEYETHPPGDDDEVNLIEDQIAVSADAVETREIRDATFRFAKTLTMPFMGAGVVDLPPGSEKKPKNSRKMHMVFFVHYGKVAVTVNEGHFRISAGGQWFVPRGNYYSITNDYDNPARIFFAQACEVAPQYEDDE